jgi:hypothetical protein
MKETIKSLFEKGEYQKLLSDTFPFCSTDDLIYRLESFWRTGNVTLAWELIDSKRVDLEKNLPLFMEVHLDLLKSKGDLSLCIKEYEHYMDLPYHSQEIEEMLKAFHLFIINPKKEENKGKSIQVIKKLLSSPKEENIWSGLYSLDSKNTKNVIEELVKLLTSNHSANIKTFALLNLVSLKYENEVVIEKNGFVYKVIPSIIEPPFIGPTHEKALQILSKMDKDPSFFQMATNLYKQYIVACYPENPLEDRLNEVITSLGVLVKRYMGLDEKIDLICEQYKITKNVLMATSEEIEIILKENQDF